MAVLLHSFIHLHLRATSSLPFGWARQLTNKRIMPTWSDRLGFRSAASSGSEATARWVEGMRSPAGINSQRQEIRWWRTWLAGWLAGWLTVLHFGAWKNRRIGEIWLDCWLLLHSIVTGEFLLWPISRYACSFLALLNICTAAPVSWATEPVFYSWLLSRSSGASWGLNVSFKGSVVVVAKRRASFLIYSFFFLFFLAQSTCWLEIQTGSDPQSHFLDAWGVIEKQHNCIGSVRLDQPLETVFY